MRKLLKILIGLAAAVGAIFGGKKLYEKYNEIKDDFDDDFEDDFDDFDEDFDYDDFEDDVFEDDDFVDEDFVDISEDNTPANDENETEDLEKETII